MSDPQKNRLLEEFQAYLEQADLSQITANEAPDLNTLLTEMTSLSAEVKVQSRHFKSSVDTLSQALSQTQAENKTLIEQLAQQNAEQLQAALLRPLLLDIADLYDRLSTGLGVLQNYQPVSSLFGGSKKEDLLFIERFKEGQTMTLNRFEQILQKYQVTAIACVGKPLDPYCMNAVEIGQDKKLENGIVLEELRKGFLVGTEVLRVAEVKVNKL